MALNFLALSALPGCPGAGILPGGVIDDGNRDPSVTSPLGKTFGEPDDTFDNPVVAVFSGSAAALQGNVAHEHDLDVYRLREMAPGDRIVVDARAENSSLDISIALFDDQGRLAYENDDVPVGNLLSLDSHIDFIVRHAGDPYYLVITHSAFGASGSRGGTYLADVTVDHGNNVPQPEGQTIFLDFDGAFVDSPVLGTFRLAPFDAADISPVYDGKTDVIKRQIVDTFRQNYERFNITAVSSDDGLPSGIYSTVYFGGFRRDAFGISESVDLYDLDRCDDAIIYTETFSPDSFTGTPTPQELGIAIGNVAAHEAGHIMGLNHTDDDADLMDDSSPADAFIDDQEFKVAPLSDDIMSIGTQDGILLLDETVGPSSDFSGPATTVATTMGRNPPPMTFAGPHAKAQSSRIIRKKMQVDKRAVEVAPSFNR